MNPQVLTHPASATSSILLFCVLCITSPLLSLFTLIISSKILKSWDISNIQESREDSLMKSEILTQPQELLTCCQFYFIGTPFFQDYFEADSRYYLSL